MNCEVMASTSGVPFYSVGCGDVFVTVGSDGNINGPYMKIVSAYDDNAVALDTGTAVKFGKYDMVVVVPHTLQWQRPF